MDAQKQPFDVVDIDPFGGYVSSIKIVCCSFLDVVRFCVIRIFDMLIKAARDFFSLSCFTCDRFH